MFTIEEGQGHCQRGEQPVVAKDSAVEEDVGRDGETSGVLWKDRLGLRCRAAANASVGFPGGDESVAVVNTDKVLGVDVIPASMDREGRAGRVGGVCSDEATGTTGSRKLGCSAGPQVPEESGVISRLS